MVFFNHATRQMTAKIVYYGPGLCGKTTNLNTIYGKTSDKARGEMVSLNTETDRTLFFDLLPMDVGVIGGFKAKLQLYTVPGQVFYNSTRKLVLKAVDGIVFVADSQTPMLDANKESLQNLEDNLRELGVDLHEIPMVFQWNKRDLKNVVPVERMEAELNPRGLTSFQSCAQDGTGVFETLRGITRLALAHIKARHFSDEVAPKAAKPPKKEPPPPPPPRESHPETGISADLRPVSELLDEVIAAPASVPQEPKAVPVPTAKHAAPQEPPKPTAHPLPAPKKLSILHPALPVAAKAKPAHTKAPVAPMLIDLGLPSGGGNVLKIDLPSVSDGQDLEVTIQVRQAGRLLAEKQTKKTPPAKGSLTKITVELKRG